MACVLSVQWSPRGNRLHNATHRRRTHMLRKLMACKLAVQLSPQGNRCYTLFRTAYNTRILRLAQWSPRGNPWTRKKCCPIDCSSILFSHTAREHCGLPDWPREGCHHPPQTPLTKQQEGPMLPLLHDSGAGATGKWTTMRQNSKFLK